MIVSPVLTNFSKPGTPETAGMPWLRAKERGVAGLAAGLRGDADEFAIAQHYDVRGEQFVGHDDQRLGERFDLGMQHFRKMPADPQHHVAHIGQPLADIDVFGLFEQLRVFVQHLVQRVGGALMPIDDPGADFFGERRIAKDGFVGRKDGGFLRADLRGDFGVQRVEIGGGGVARAFEMGQLRHHFFGFQLAGGWIDEDFVDAISGAHDDARRYANALAHSRQL